ncbi:CD180 antigen [Biomphalaria pfeifferi]|uniref:CD180 antigen n=1 Tax=Biomphalaria pfeifferi TaxID=112525 RepID=A0AAD8CAL9_BIOPF|nr:CD180 antigen [Biomphalaria pfeifferi]
MNLFILLLLTNFQLYTCGTLVDENTSWTVTELKQRNGNPCDVTLDLVNVVVNCSSRSLQFIIKSWFPESTSVLMLQSNLLTVVPNNTLNNLYRLLSLSLQDNMLTYIEPKSFERLHSLQYLNLENNRLNLFSLPVLIFSDLVNLTELRLSQDTTNSVYNLKRLNTVFNASTGSFPDQMFGHLIHLRALSVDVHDDLLYFNPEFQNLPLTKLQLSGKLKTITESSFENVKTVKDLSWNNFGYIQNVSSSALGTFVHLEQFTLNEVRLGVRNSLHLLRPLVNSSMKLLKLSTVPLIPNLKYLSITSQDGILDEESTRYLRDICIEELHLQSNNIFIILKGAFSSQTLDRCLKRVYVTFNPIQGTLQALLDVILLKSLQVLVITSFKYKAQGWAGTSTLKQLESQYVTITDKLGELINVKTNNSRTYTVKLFISRSIEYFEFGSLFGEINWDVPIEVHGGDNVQELRLMDCAIQNVQYSLEGLSHVKTVYLSFNTLSVLPVTFFDSFPEVEVLVLDHCELDSEFMSQHSYSLFRNLVKLKQLDLSYNALDILLPNTFSAHLNLSSLNLAFNRFRTIPFDLSQTLGLNKLDMRQNSLDTLSSKDMALLDELQHRLGEFQLLISGNVLSCGCEHIQFLQWLHRTDVRLDENRNYTCINNQGMLSSTSAYKNIEVLWRECWGQFYFNIALGMFAFVNIGFVFVFMLSKNKTSIISGILQLFTEFKLKRPVDYQYSVFIGYSDFDYQFACLTLRKFIEDDLKLSTFVGDRDLLPSIAMAEGIMAAMDSSWRIVLVVNKSFVNNNDWFLFMVRSAVFSVSPANPLRVVILVEECCIPMLPCELLSSVPEDNVFVVTEWKMTYKLQQGLRTRLKE